VFILQSVNSFIISGGTKIVKGFVSGKFLQTDSIIIECKTGAY